VADEARIDRLGGLAADGLAGAALGLDMLIMFVRYPGKDWNDGI
jgi:hypothetical protein